MSMIPSLLDRMARSKLAIAYGLLVVAIIIGFFYLEQLAHRLEREALARSSQVCQSTNNTKAVVASVLDALAAPRDDDEPGEFEQRIELRNQLRPLLQETECPPDPEAEVENRESDAKPLPTP